MLNWTPHDMPFVAEKSYQWCLEIARQRQNIERLNGDAAALDAAMYDEMYAKSLQGNHLSWIDADVCDLIESTRGNLPDWTPSTCLPAPQGVIGFETPFFTAEWNSEAGIFQVSIDAISWLVHGEYVSIAAWATRAPENASKYALARVLCLTIELDGTVETKQDLGVLGEVARRNPNAILRDTQEMMKVAGATWLLMTQPKVVDESHTPPLHVRKRDAATGKTVKRPVRVSVRKLASEPAQQRRSMGRKAMSRWWVRGHWRQQPWGKGRKLRKPIYIAPHLAGNPDADVDDRPSVQVWRK